MESPAFADSYDFHYQGNYAPAQAPAAERHVLAERYKTKKCRNFELTGECPYETRCMFAHGNEEMRTSEMNVRDGLITEEAIKAFQRMLTLRQRQQEMEQHYGIPEFIGMPPVNLGPERFAHNPYGYPVMRPSQEDHYHVAHFAKADPMLSSAMEP